LSLALANAIFAFVAALGESQIYRDLMRFKPDGLSPNAWALKAGVSRTVWTDMRRHGNPSRRTLEKLLAAAGSSLLEFEALRIGPEAARPGIAADGRVADLRRGWNPAPLPPIPLVGSRLGGEWGQPGSAVELTELRPGELVDRLPRPTSLSSDPAAFAVTIVGGSMVPRFAPGTRVAVSPRAPVAVGDDVLARLPTGQASDGAQQVLVLRLVKRTATGFELRQFNPDRTICVDAADVEAVLKIVGELI
jgi:hypothetical protein